MHTPRRPDARNPLSDEVGMIHVLWRNTVAGDVWVWLMDEPVKMSERYVGIVPDLRYQIITVK